MIKVWGTRDKGGGEFYKDCPALREVPAAKAFSTLVGAELMWGGAVTELTPTRITVETQVLGCQDVTYFEGPEAEMLPLVQVAAAYSAQKQDAVVKSALSLIDNTLGELGGIPLYLSMYAGRAIGESRLKLALLYPWAKQLTPALADKAAKTSLKDMAAVAELLIEGTPIQEAFEIA